MHSKIVQVKDDAAGAVWWSPLSSPSGLKNYRFTRPTTCAFEDPGVGAVGVRRAHVHYELMVATLVLADSLKMECGTLAKFHERRIVALRVEDLNACTTGT